MKFNIRLINEYVLNIFLFALSVIILLGPSIFNRFPIVHPDTGTYIDSGFNEIVPIDRPIMYGLFVRHISLAHTLWFIVIFQAIVVAGFILFMYKYVLGSDYSFLKTFVTICILAITTALPQYVCQIMPDIFAGIGILGLFIFFLPQKLPKLLLILVGIFVVFSCTVHLSNLSVNTLIIICCFGVALIFRKRPWMQLRRGNIINVSIVLLISWIFVPSINKMFGDEFRISKAKNVVVAANLIELGIMTDYMDEYCEEKGYAFCEYLKEIKGAYKKAPTFVWNTNSPLYCGGCKDKGWRNCWIERHEELSVIISDIMGNAKYRKRLIKTMFKTTIEQVYTFHTSGFSPMLEGIPPHWNIKFYLKRDLEPYIKSCQSGNGVRFGIRDTIQKVVVLLSFVLFVIGLILSSARKSVNPRLWFVFGFIILTFLVNAFICASLSHVVGRYQGRIIWLLPLIAIIAIFELFSVTIFLRDAK